MSDIDKIFQLDFKSGIYFILAMILLFVWIMKNWDWIVARFGIKTKHALDEERREEAIEELKRDSAEGKEHMKTTDENVLLLMQKFEEMSASISSLQQQVTDMQVKADKNEMSRLSDRIVQAYRYYKEKKHWTEMEKWAFNNLVDSYKSSGGDSFIDEKVVPESYTWEVDDKD